MATAKATRANAQSDKIVIHRSSGCQNGRDAHRDTTVLPLNGAHRSVGLARRYGMTSRDARRTQSIILDDGREQFRISSRSDATRHYTVTYDPISQLAFCDCPSQCGACWHRGTVLMEIERREREWNNARAWDREDRREMAAIAIAYHESRERAGSHPRMRRDELTYAPGWVPAMGPGPDMDEE